MSLSELPIPTSLLFLFAVLLISVITDIRFRKIRNWLVLTGLVGALLLHFNDGGWYATKQGLIGAAVAFAVTVPMVALKLFGPGDSKLMLVVGATVGTTDFFTVLAISFLLSGLMAIVGSLVTGRLKVFGANLSIGLLSMVYMDWKSARSIADHTAYRVPFALPVFVATACWLYWFY